MAHVPHLLLSGPWESDRLRLSTAQSSHLERVLRMRSGDRISYTDGEGSLGTGRYEKGWAARGEESSVARPSDLVVVSAAPDNRDRTRFLVEKLAELGVAELVWLATRFGQGRPPREDRQHSWAVAGLEQSRGAWLMKTSGGLVTFSDITSPFAVCAHGGGTERPHARTVVIGPEGGWARDEVPATAITYDLGQTILRVETAAIVAASRLI